MGKILPVWPREIKVTPPSFVISVHELFLSGGRGSIHQKNKTKLTFLYIQSSDSISSESGVRASLKRRKEKSADLGGGRQIEGETWSGLRTLPASDQISTQKEGKGRYSWLLFTHLP